MLGEMPELFEQAGKWAFLARNPIFHGFELTYLVNLQVRELPQYGLIRNGGIFFNTGCVLNL